MKALKTATIFVEGPEDARFLRDVVEKWYGIKLTLPPEKVSGEKKQDEEKQNELQMGEIADFVYCGGKSNIAMMSPTFQHSSVIMGLQNILFLDADSLAKDEHLGGLDNTLSYIERLKIKHFITIDKAFIFPNTIVFNQEIRRGETGDMETILEQIVVERSLLACWKAYEECIEASAIAEQKRYQAPKAKTKFYAYTEAVLRNADKAGGSRRSYQNKFWNLDPNQPYLKVLKEFLDSIISLK
jgi:hypothetical protein